MDQPQDFDGWQKELREAQLSVTTAELHGIVTGFLCTGVALSLARMTDLLQQPLSPNAQTSVLRMVRDAQVSLVDEDFRFEPLLPGEDADVADRVRGLSAWCGGFLQGFGGAGEFKEAELPENVREVLPDLLQIASIRDDVPDNDDNEADLTEIAEYVRVAVMTVYLECSKNARNAGPDSDETGKHVH